MVNGRQSEEENSHHLAIGSGTVLSSSVTEKAWCIAHQVLHRLDESVTCHPLVRTFTTICKQWQEKVVHIFYVSEAWPEQLLSIAVQSDFFHRERKRHLLSEVKNAMLIQRESHTAERK